MNLFSLTIRNLAKYQTNQIQNLEFKIILLMRFMNPVLLNQKLKIRESMRIIAQYHNLKKLLIILNLKNT